MIKLVLLPGMDGTGLLFADFISALGLEFETHVVTYPDAPSLGYKELELVARSFLPDNQPFVLLAESFSGPIAISISASKPRGLIGLILCCSFARNPRFLLAGIETLLKLFPPKLAPMGILSKYLLGRSSSNHLRVALEEALATISSNTLRARVKAVAAIDVSAKLIQIQIPILYLRAIDDFLVTHVASDHILEIAPHVRVVDLEGPHLLLQASPHLAARVVTDFSRSALKIPNES